MTPPPIREIVDLGTEYFDDMPRHGDQIVAFWPTETYRSARKYSNRKVAFESHMIQMSEHCGTHLDAPYHWDENGATVDRIPLENLVLPGFLLDFSSKRAREPITVADFETAERTSGQHIGPGMAIVARTGVDRQWGQEGFKVERPFVPVESAAWLVQRKITLFATDLIGIDDPTQWWWPTHVTFLKGGVPMVQQLCNLDRLVGKDFHLVVLPWRMRGGTGSPLRPVALVH